MSGDDDDTDDDDTSPEQQVKRLLCLSQRRVDVPCIGVTTLIGSRCMQSDSWKAHGQSFQQCFYSAYAGRGKIAKAEIAHTSVLALPWALTKLRLRLLGCEIEVYDVERLVLDDRGEPRTLRGVLDYVAVDSNDRLCVIDLKVTQIPYLTLARATCKVKNELQLRCYAALLKRALKLDYVPQAYLAGVHMRMQGEMGVWSLPLAEADVDDYTAATSSQPDYYAPVKMVATPAAAASPTVVRLSAAAAAATDPSIAELTAAAAQLTIAPPAAAKPPTSANPAVAKLPATADPVDEPKS